MEFLHTIPTNCIPLPPLLWGDTAIYLSHVSRSGQCSSHFKEMWNYFGKIKLAEDKIKGHRKYSDFNF